MCGRPRASSVVGAGFQGASRGQIGRCIGREIKRKSGARTSRRSRPLPRSERKVSAAMAWVSVRSLLDGSRESTRGLGEGAERLRELVVAATVQGGAAAGEN